MGHSPRTRNHPLLRACLIAILLLTSSFTSVVASQATPAPHGDTRLYIGHAGGFTAEIPADWNPDWNPDRSLDHEYAGRDGFISTGSTAFSPRTFESAEAACEDIAGTDMFDGRGEVELTDWREMAACLVRVPEKNQDGPMSLVFPHPEPAPDGSTAWVAVTVDTEHFDEITQSISFDLSGVTAAMYLDAALDILQTHSLWRDAVDWTELREEAHARLGSFADTDSYWVAHSALRIAIEALYDAGADGHTYLVPATNMDAFVNAVFESTTYTPPTGDELEHGIGYISVPGFSGSEEAMAGFTADLHAIIADQATTTTCGWIVDLRGNTGGSFPPMIGGLAPLAPEDTLIRLRDANGEETEWALNASGEVEYEGEPWDLATGVVAPVDPRLSAQPVAVLVGSQTLSAGEATAISFADRDRTAFFGEPTGDFATAPLFFPLLDGSLLSIASAWMVGPQGAIYPDGIAPDVTVSPSDIVATLVEDPVVAEASAWLQQQPDCEPTATPAA